MKNYYQVSLREAKENILINLGKVYVKFFGFYFEFKGEVEQMSNNRKYYLKSK